MAGIVFKIDGGNGEAEQAQGGREVVEILDPVKETVVAVSFPPPCRA